MYIGINQNDVFFPLMSCISHIDALLGTYAVLHDNNNNNDSNNNKKKIFKCLCFSL